MTPADWEVLFNTIIITIVVVLWLGMTINWLGRLNE